jgi:hypothetical protein
MNSGYVWGVESSVAEGSHHAVVLKAGPERTAATIGPALAVERAYIAEVNTAFEEAFLRAAHDANFDFVSFTSRAFGNLDEDGGGYKLSEMVLRPKLVVHYEYEVEWAEELLSKALDECVLFRHLLADTKLEPEISFQQVLACA